MRHWFTKEWWACLFAPRGFMNNDVWLIKVLWCRLRNHPYPITWYNPSGWEPDYTCTNCGDDLS